ncbi:bifunctional aspartate kinase-homoserine dehydrogenase family protein [Klebsormidium nitens]|uniref:Homoserine dehydrogenase n=1 Tax=Klebsormidium nitens TaxID=105231 RepID=A0A1Y1IRM1_KLENI|nr:bifunctional aspartate kinase-homoserine dehydrogenase family protein [Klebsormidium nitens]|eukprot:GAQ91386.1 bifunctional aspartate kinase-homoserine dehydrogenase family protein [Klebsormidium nitens]
MTAASPPGGRPAPDAVCPAIPVVVLGLGGVGRTLLQHILRTRESLAQGGLRVVVHAVVDSQHILTDWSPGGIADPELRAIVEAKAARRPLSSLSSSETNKRLTSHAHGGSFESLLPPAGGASRVYVDCTSTADLGCTLVQALPRLAGLVLANKKPLTDSLAVYDAVLRAGRRVRYEATCGAGLPVLGTLDRMLGAGDEIQRIAGALSGTLGYVMAGLEEGRPLSEVVRAAKAAGYTEPDPRDDLAGTDVARKALILARKLGWRLELADVAVESLVPPHLAPAAMPLPLFLEAGLPTLDDAMAQRCAAARRDGNVLRYAATIEGGSCRVGLLAVAPDSPLGRLKGSDNLVAISSRCYASSPLVIQGAGAGNDTTAAGVLADILDMQDRWAGAASGQ